MYNIYKMSTLLFSLLEFPYKKQETHQEMR